MDYSADEWVILIVSAFICLTLWNSWYAALNKLPPLAKPEPHRIPLYALFFGCLIILYLVLQFFASSDVRSSLAYIFFYLLLGAAWLRVWLWLLPLVGLIVRDDVVERGNQAAAFSIGGMLIGVTFCYAGGNIGEGPSWIVVVFSALVATSSLFLLWLLLNGLVNITETVTIDRDSATGLRLAFFLISAGLILGRAVAGDWISFDATIKDFIRFGWPVLVLFVIAIGGELLFRPTKERPVGSITAQGIFPAIVYLATAFIALYISSVPATPR